MIKRTVILMISFAQPIGAVAPLERSIALSDTQSVLKMLERRYITDFEMKQYIGQATARIAVQQQALNAGYSLADIALLVKGTVYLSMGASGIAMGLLLSEIASIANLTRRLQVVSFLSGGILGLHGLGFLWKAFTKKSRIENITRAYAVKQMLLQARTLASSQGLFVTPAIVDTSRQLVSSAIVSMPEVAQLSAATGHDMAL